MTSHEALLKGNSTFFRIHKKIAFQNPTEEVRSNRTWSDTRDISVYRQTGEVKAQISLSPKVLVQATGWHRNAQGKIE
jgi:large exoprotein involved in heme utilization and adhesion